jgi:hypothetical protein
VGRKLVEEFKLGGNPPQWHFVHSKTAYYQTWNRTRGWPGGKPATTLDIFLKALSLFQDYREPNSFCPLILTAFRPLPLFQVISLKSFPHLESSGLRALNPSCPLIPAAFTPSSKWCLVSQEWKVVISEKLSIGLTRLGICFFRSFSSHCIEGFSVLMKHADFRSLCVKRFIISPISVQQVLFFTAFRSAPGPTQPRVQLSTWGLFPRR